MTPSHFDNSDFARRYAEGPGQFVPGYEAMQQMASQLLAERARAAARVLVVGAGGGLETLCFARLNPEWTFVAIEPARSMIEEGKRRLDEAGVSDRVEWVHGYIDDAPEGPFDGASCLLTLHFVPDDGAKLHTLQAIRRRLLPHGRLALVDLCIDMSDPHRDVHLDRYVRFALQSGADPDDVAETRERLVAVLRLVSSQRDELLLREAGFESTELFYAGLSWRGWISEAGKV